MNTNYQRDPARFRPGPRQEWPPDPPAPFRADQDNALDRLKDRLLLELLWEQPEPRLTGDLRRAANEAAALAWVTPYPLLVFPALFAEKADSVRVQAERQKSVRQRSRELLSV